MAVGTKKKLSHRKPRSKTRAHYYERTIVQPAARLITAITKTVDAAKTAAG